jgi:hypothetical protein
MEEPPMPEADQDYISDNPSAMSRRTLLAALIAAIMPKPVAAMPITCIGMKPTVAELVTFADIRSAAQSPGL